MPLRTECAEGFLYASGMRRSAEGRRRGAGASGEGFRGVSSGCADATARCEMSFAARGVARIGWQGPFDAKNAVGFGGDAARFGAGGWPCCYKGCRSIRRRCRLLRKVPLDLAAMSVCAKRGRANRGGARAVCGGAFTVSRPSVGFARRSLYRSNPVDTKVRISGSAVRQ